MKKQTVLIRNAHHSVEKLNASVSARVDSEIAEYKKDPNCFADLWAKDSNMTEEEQILFIYRINFLAKQNTQPVSTKGEWSIIKIKGKIASRFDGINGHCMIADEKGRCHDIETDTRQEAEAIAKKVVIAVNMHDELIDKMKKLSSLYTGTDHPSTKIIIEVQALLQQAEQK